MFRVSFIGVLAEWLRQNITATTEQIEGWLVSGAQLLLQSLAARGVATSCSAP